MQSSCINIYPIEYLDAGRRSAEIFRNLSKESKKRIKLLKRNIRHLQREIYAERLRYIQNEELGLKMADAKVELGPEMFRFKAVEELYI